MPRYHFHAADTRRYPDREGEILPDLRAAQATGLAVFTEMPRVKSDEFWDSRTFSVTVKDDTGRIVAVITASAILDPVARAAAPPQ